MPTLNWIGKEAVVKHHKAVPFRLLEPVPELSCGPVDSGNLIVQGDNLDALKALLPRYAGKVKCIYIDPPYNTGNEGWVYNDNVNSPEIRRWLGQVVGKEGETLDRHDRWLCMMYPRLVLLKQFLSEDGAIFVSIDDNEAATLRLLMDEVFGAGNFVAAIAWHKRVSPANDAKYFSSDLDSILVFAKKLDLWRPNRLPMSEKQVGNYKNPDEDLRGDWNSSAYTCAKTMDERPNLYYPIMQPNTGKEIWPNKKRVWAYEPNTHALHVAQDMIYWGADGLSEKPRMKKFLTTAKLVVPRSFWTPSETGHNQEAKLELNDFGIFEHFATPKPTRLIQRILQIATDKDSLILDSFAGSGTTGHAVLKQNAEDGGTRRFIQVEIDAGIAKNVTVKRVTRAAIGYTDVKGNAVEGLGIGKRAGGDS
jgi:adenine-specific DNA-methyltransferase